MPSRMLQVRSAIDVVTDRIQEQIFPSQSVVNSEISDDEDLLAPTKVRSWRALFKRPDLASFLAVFILSLVVANDRLGVIAGGALPESPRGVSELWKLYAESWHQVGLGSSSATPTWIAVVALIGTITFGNAQLFISRLFLFAPLILFSAIFIWLRKVTNHIWLAIFGGALNKIKGAKRKSPKDGDPANAARWRIHRRAGGADIDQTGNGLP